MSTSRGAVRATVLVLAFTALACAAYLWVEALTSRASLERLTTRVNEAVAEAKARDPRRPLLRGEAVPGNAWTEYRQGLTLVERAKVSDVRHWLDGAAPADREKAVALLPQPSLTFAIMSVSYGWPRAVAQGHSSAAVTTR